MSLTNRSITCPAFSALRKNVRHGKRCYRAAQTLFPSVLMVLTLVTFNPTSAQPQVSEGYVSTQPILTTIDCSFEEVQAFLDIDVDTQRSPASSRTWQWVTEPDPTIQARVNEVAWEGLRTKIQMLQDFGTRLKCGPTRYAVAESLAVFFGNLGLEVTLQEFLQPKSLFCSESVTAHNVIATQTGLLFPDSIVIISGHWDSMSETPTSTAPGADDNASGVAAVMTAAELLSQHQFAYTIKYICFGGEEYGGWGSAFYVRRAYADDLNIVGVLNFDMIGWWEDGLDFDLEVEANESSLWLAEAVLNAADLYTDTPCDTHVTDLGVSDNLWFWKYGYPALNNSEGMWVSYDVHDPDFNPRWHTAGDCLQYLDPNFTVACARVAVGALATVARFVQPIAVFFQSFEATAYDSGVELVWDIISDEDLMGFRIYRRAEGSQARKLLNVDNLIPSVARKYVDREVRAGPSYEYTLGVVLADGSESVSQTVTVETKAYELALHQNHPNPFNPSTTISFAMPKREKANIAVYNIEGKLVTTLVDETLDAGLKEVIWNGTDARGNQVSTGVYFYRLAAGNRTLTRKMVLLK